MTITITDLFTLPALEAHAQIRKTTELTAYQRRQLHDIVGEHAVLRLGWNVYRGWGRPEKCVYQMGSLDKRTAVWGYFFIEDVITHYTIIEFPQCPTRGRETEGLYRAGEEYWYVRRSFDNEFRLTAMIAGKRGNRLGIWALTSADRPPECMKPIDIEFIPDFGELRDSDPEELYAPLEEEHLETKDGTKTE